MNNNPLSEDIVRKRFNDAGYEIIDYTYKTNRTRMLCYDKDGYKVKVSLDSLRFNTKEYARFSPSSNIEGFMYNIQKYQKTHSELPQVLDWEYVDVGNDGKKHIWLLCACGECGNKFWCHLTDWKNRVRTRCADCVRIESNLEILVRKWFEENGVQFVEQKRFDDCRDKRKLPFDFFLPEYNCCIEVDGIQHFQCNLRLHGHLFTKDELFDIQRRDNIKNEYCKRNNIDLLGLSYLDFKDKNKYKQILSDKFIADRD